MDSRHANGEKLTTMDSGSGENGLSRQLTMQLSADQYERLFFQPTAAKGDLAKRLGNPTLLGLCGFLVPFTSVVFSCLQFRGSNSTSFTEFSGAFYFLGGIAMVIAGICEFVLGNTFPFAVFIIFGSHWCQVAYSFDPAHNLTGAYGNTAAAALSRPLTSGAANYDIAMTLISFVFFLASLRTNVPFAMAIFFLIPLFAFFAAAEWQLGSSGGDPLKIEHAAYLLKIAGGFGFITMISGWYLAIITACASTGVPCPLPIFDLSTKVFAGSSAKKMEHAGSVQIPAGQSTHA